MPPLPPEDELDDALLLLELLDPLELLLELPLDEEEEVVPPPVPLLELLVPLLVPLLVEWLPAPPPP